ncbi:hypothetical protein [Paenibacillus sp. sgz500958]|uniref:hypothetical protein n=1 Tax=Paenibacillus sp. sgz500958 TaxID=3242475 RepID=UPI0036D25D6D
MGAYLKIERKSGYGGWRVRRVVSIMILIAILRTVSVSATYQVHAAASSANVVSGSIIQHPYLTIQILKENKPVYIRPGMTKQQVDHLLGKPTEIGYPGFRGYAYGNSITTGHVTVGYLNGLAASISTTGYETSLNGQFKFGTPWKKVLMKLGQPSRTEDSRREYVFQLTKGNSNRFMVQLLKK